MKSVRLARILRPVKEINRMHGQLCGGFVDAERAEKLRYDGGTEFISTFYGRADGWEELHLKLPELRIGSKVA